MGSINIEHIFGCMERQLKKLTGLFSPNLNGLKRLKQEDLLGGVVALVEAVTPENVNKGDCLNKTKLIKNR